MESFEVTGVDNQAMLAWGWGVVKNQAGHGTAGAGEGVLSFGRTSDSSSGVTKSIGSVRVFVKTSTASWANPDRPDAKDFTGRYVTSGSSTAPFIENIAV